MATDPHIGPLCTHAVGLRVITVGLHFCGAVIRFPVYAVFYGKKAHCFDFMPLILEDVAPT